MADSVTDRATCDAEEHCQQRDPGTRNAVRRTCCGYPKGSGHRPFTVEAVPAPVVKALDDIEEAERAIDASIARSGETLRQGDWRDELLKTGIRGKGGQRIEFSRVEPLPGTRWLQADAETKEDTPQRVVVSFGPDYAPLEQRQVELALGRSRNPSAQTQILSLPPFSSIPRQPKISTKQNGRA